MRAMRSLLDGVVIGPELATRSPEVLAGAQTLSHHRFYWSVLTPWAGAGFNKVNGLA